MNLKNHTQTTDPRLDRVVQFDERSRSFGILDWIQEWLAKRKQRSYTWRCTKVLDQGAEGACVGFGVTHELIARPVEITELNARFAREQIYWEAQKIDPWEGGSYPGASVFYEGTSVLAGVKMAQALGYCENYYWAFGLEDLKEGVAKAGPAIMGLTWREGMFRPSAGGYIYPTGEVMGGHCILCKGVNFAKERFTLHNSWGPDWGNNGECYVKFSDMDKMLRDYGEACFLINRKRP